MKTKLLYTLTIVLFCTAGNYAHASFGKLLPRAATHKKFSDSLQIHSNTVRKNTVKLSPNPTSSGTLQITSNSDEHLYFYVFDVEGTIVHRFILQGKEKQTINDLKKGIYTYDVFKDDESIEQGKIVVK